MLRLESLPRSVFRPLAAARLLARKEGIALYLVGGCVRDLLLGRPVADVDLVVEEEAAGFARRLARELEAGLKLHGRFGTATLALRGGGRLDLATARAEHYERPGALPRVEPGSIEDDLARRDFTVNAMAMEIARTRRPALLDSFGGRADLRRRRVRMLHPRSAFDDPTRAFRAVRYANRLGFRIEKITRGWIRAAIAAGAVDAISGDRLRRELARLLAEPNRAAAVREMHALGLAKAIHPALRFDARVARRLTEAERLAGKPGLHPSWLAYLLAWMGEISEPDAGAIASRVNLPRGTGRVVREWPATWKSLAHADRTPPPELSRRLEGLRDDQVLAAAAISSAPGRRALFSAWSEAAAFRLTIRGRDLVRAGVPPGPAIGRALSATRSARREGTIRPEDELAFALKAARS